MLDNRVNNRWNIRGIRRNCGVGNRDHREKLDTLVVTCIQCCTWRTNVS
jgi:hypothetical protein